MARTCGHKAVNFPRAGTDEVEAEAGVKEHTTLVLRAPPSGYGPGECRGSIARGYKPGTFHAKLYTVGSKHGVYVGYNVRSTADAERALADEAGHRGLR